MQRQRGGPETYGAGARVMERRSPHPYDIGAVHWSNIFARNRNNIEGYQTANPGSLNNMLPRFLWNKIFARSRISQLLEDRAAQRDEQDEAENIFLELRNFASSDFLNQLLNLARAEMARLDTLIWQMNNNWTRQIRQARFFGLNRRYLGDGQYAFDSYSGPRSYVPLPGHMVFDSD